MKEIVTEPVTSTPIVKKRLTNNSNCEEERKWGRMSIPEPFVL